MPTHRTAGAYSLGSTEYVPKYCIVQVWGEKEKVRIIRSVMLLASEY